ncbi:B-box type zinc finger protein with CCT domain-containing protein [Rhynchospora pubera]|uniref:B-box type zinc finger protein with CCT domain-containing protein n=1 Tax=Rhynchospora pubera TaxID=906938 RepID=A0AAV8F699_9POAL|nr:B-box type zinc finger protein with CCT domain-containing protein [Rhynchospora pubera]
MPRSRPKTRKTKTKYLSLRRHLASRPSSPLPPPPEQPNPVATATSTKQADLFPVQPDPDVRDPQVASLLFSSTNGETGETLTEILGTSTGSASASASAPGHASDSCSAGSGSPGSPPVVLDTGDEDSDGLARRALRGRQRVEYCCSSSSSEEEVISASAAAAGPDLWCSSATPHPHASLLLKLKLDYEEILTAWSGRGSLYIDQEPEPPQVVPGFHPTAFPVWVMVSSSGEAAAMSWTVPEKAGGEKAEKEEVETREMRVKRYKEKRQNRLFAKKIRYEVRKLNAEKRPRLKGRFIKAIEDV